MTGTEWKYCPDCGSKIFPPGIYCIGCGKKLSETEKIKKPKVTKQGNLCSKCGGQLNNLGYCENCKGYSI